MLEVVGHRELFSSRIVFLTPKENSNMTKFKHVTSNTCFDM